MCDEGMGTWETISNTTSHTAPLLCSFCGIFNHVQTTCKRFIKAQQDAQNRRPYGLTVVGLRLRVAVHCPRGRGFDSLAMQVPKVCKNHCSSCDQLTKAVGLESASCCRGRGGVIVCLRASKRMTTSKAQRWVGTPALVYPKGAERIGHSKYWALG